MTLVFPGAVQTTQHVYYEIPSLEDEFQLLCVEEFFNKPREKGINPLSPSTNTFVEQVTSTVSKKVLEKPKPISEENPIKFETVKTIPQNVEEEDDILNEVRKCNQLFYSVTTPNEIDLEEEEEKREKGIIPHFEDPEKPSLLEEPSLEEPIYAENLNFQIWEILGLVENKKT